MSDLQATLDKVWCLIASNLDDRYTGHPLELTWDHFGYSVISKDSGEVLFTCLANGRVVESLWQEELPVNPKAAEWYRNKCRQWTLMQDVLNSTDEELLDWVRFYHENERDGTWAGLGPEVRTYPCGTKYTRPGRFYPDENFRLVRDELERRGVSTEEDSP